MVSWAATPAIRLPEWLGELAVDVSARQADIPQVTVGELRGVALLTRPLTPQAPKLSQTDEVKMRSLRQGHIEVRRMRQRMVCIVCHDWCNPMCHAAARRACSSW
jgi:hypothetical protein